MEENKNEEKQVDNAANVENQDASKNEEKKYTEKEMTEIVKKEVARKTKNNPSKEELEEFKNWKESQKTDEEKKRERDEELEKLLKENKFLKNSNAVANAGIDKRFSKFIISEVSEIDGDFEENLANYLKENPQFLEKQEPKKTETTGFEMNNTQKTKTELETYLDKKYANNPYYKK